MEKQSWWCTNVTCTTFICSLLNRRVIETVDPTRHDLRVRLNARSCSEERWRIPLNSTFKRTGFKSLLFCVLKLADVILVVQTQLWFTPVDLRNTYFHVSFIQEHRCFSRFAFQGQAFQFSFYLLRHTYDSTRNRQKILK